MLVCWCAEFFCSITKWYLVVFALFFELWHTNFFGVLLVCRPFSGVLSGCLHCCTPNTPGCKP